MKKLFVLLFFIIFILSACSHPSFIESFEQPYFNNTNKSISILPVIDNRVKKDKFNNLIKSYQSFLYHRVKYSNLFNNVDSCIEKKTLGKLNLQTIVIDLSMDRNITWKTAIRAGGFFLFGTYLGLQAGFTYLPLMFMGGGGLWFIKDAVDGVGYNHKYFTKLNFRLYNENLDIISNDTLGMFYEDVYDEGITNISFQPGSSTTYNKVQTSYFRDSYKINEYQLNQEMNIITDFYLDSLNKKLFLK